MAVKRRMRRALRGAVRRPRGATGADMVTRMNNYTRDAYNPPAIFRRPN